MKQAAPDFSLPTILYGGTFDPVHAGHLQVARDALTTLPEFKQLVFVPAAHSPGKAPALASPAQRLEWLRLAAEPLGFPVWGFEIERGGESFTVHTLEAATAAGARPEALAWLLGADAYRGFGRWRSPERVRALCRLVVAHRPGEPLNRQQPADLVLEIPRHPASSTILRQRLFRGEAAADWLPTPVRAALDKLLPGQNPYVRNLP